MSVDRGLKFKGDYIRKFFGILHKMLMLKFQRLIVACVKLSQLWQT